MKLINWGWLKYVLAGSGIPIALIIYFSTRPPAPVSSYQKRVADSFGVSEGMMANLSRISIAAESGKRMSEAGWRENLDGYQQGNQAAKEMALMTLVYLGKNSPHPKASDELAKQYLSTCKPEDALVGIHVLYRLGDPSWKTYYQRGIQGADPTVQTQYQNYALRAMKLAPSQIPGR